MENYKNFGNIINDIIDTYFSNGIKQQILTYYRIFFVFYIIVRYVDKIEDKDKIKKIFFEYLNIKFKSKEIIEKNFIKYFDHFYDTFFIKQNIYFHTYFNNLINE